MADDEVATTEARRAARLKADPALRLQLLYFSAVFGGEVVDQVIRGTEPSELERLGLTVTPDLVDQARYEAEARATLAALRPALGLRAWCRAVVRAALRRAPRLRLWLRSVRIHWRRYRYRGSSKG